MLTGGIFLLIIIFILIIIIIVIIYKPQTYIDQFTSMLDGFFKPDKSPSQETRTKLGLTSIDELKIMTTEMHYRYRIDNASHNRIVIVMINDGSNVYMNDRYLTDVLSSENGTTSMLGYSIANSGAESICVIRTALDTKDEPRVYIGSGRQPSRSTSPKSTRMYESPPPIHVEEIDGDSLDGI